MKELRDEVLSTIPLRRLGQPEEIAKVVVFLASKDTDYLTGQAIKWRDRESLAFQGK